MNKSRNKENLFNLYEEIYTKGMGELDLCKNCNSICEKGPDIVVLLPFEAHFILEKARKQKLESKFSEIRDIGVIDPTPKCPFVRNKKCIIHSFRPVDCRSYPLVPVFSKDSFELNSCRTCLHADKISKDFLNQTLIVWRKLFPFLSVNWRQKYNRTLRSSLLKKIPPHLQLKK